MKKVELESMLMDPEGIKRLADRAADIKRRHGVMGETQGRPAFKVRATEPLVHEVRPTQDEICKNDRDYLGRYGPIINITRYIPEMAKADPKSALKVLIGKTRKDFSESNQALLESAINRLLSQVVLDDTGQKLVKEAIQVLELSRKPKKGEEVQK